MKDKIRASGGDLGDQEFEKIMLRDGSKSGLDPAKGGKTQTKVKVIDQIKGVRKGEPGRAGAGRFNREFDKER